MSSIQVYARTEERFGASGRLLNAIVNADEFALNATNATETPETKPSTSSSGPAMLTDASAAVVGKNEENLLQDWPALDEDWTLEEDWILEEAAEHHAAGSILPTAAFHAAADNILYPAPSSTLSAAIPEQPTTSSNKRKAALNNTAIFADSSMPSATKKRRAPPSKKKRKVSSSTTKKTAPKIDDDVVSAGSGETTGTAKKRARHFPRWEDKYEELKQFRQEHGHCRVPRRNHNYRYAAQLERWIRSQREMMKKMNRGEKSTLTPERIAKLDALGFIWDASNGKKKKSSQKSKSKK